MDFKQYYHNRLDEEGNLMQEPLDVDAPVQQVKPIAQPATTNGGMIAPYVNKSSLKLGFAEMAKDLGDSIFEYATKQAVQPTDFKSEDDYNKYCQNMRRTIVEKYNVTLKEVLTNIGLLIDTEIHTSCPNK